MYTRILIASAALAALATAAPVQAQPKHNFLFSFCNFAQQTQCAKSFIHGSYNKSRIEQDQWKKGFQIGLHIQNGDNNGAYTGQSGTNEIAVTIQNGNNNTSGIHQDGSNLNALTVQNSDGAWHTTGMSGNGGTVVSYQSN